MKMMNVTIQTKIILLVLTLITLVIIALSGFFAYLESEEIEDTLGDKALSTATYIASAPTVRDAFQTDNPSEVLQPYAERVREQSGAEFVVIGNESGIRYAHPDEWKIGEEMVGGDNHRALTNGESYVSQAEGTLGPSLRGKAPIRDNMGNIIGVVSVGFLIEDLHAVILERLSLLGLLALAAVFIGTLGAVVLSKSIRKDMYGLEPYQIAHLFRERQAILSAIREGIIAIDKDGCLTLINHSARTMLDLSEPVESRPIKEILPDSVMERVLEHGRPEYNQELPLQGKIFIVNREPIFDNNQIVGVVSTFRDKTEMMEMANTLSDIKRYSDDLRSQNHEYTNKLYALSGYLHLGQTKEAIQLIEEETISQKKQTEVLFSQIKDTTVQAILAGKSGRASEMKVAFDVDQASHLEPLPAHMSQTKIISILGNVIDNALDAAKNSLNPKVTFFVTDIGNDVVFEISDNGPGLPYDADILMEKGFSTKQSIHHKRGYGLTIVGDTVSNLDGMLEFDNKLEGGAFFSIYLPKKPSSHQGGEVS
ncbi:two-component system, CitB family, sensor histidine kinase CitS [Alteribacillus persepolensis]|uniref:histidine kinase n=1 Tax=Alteribacillus persepolensis TaxID=568899 RepID=A0A1G8C4V9_9BACI|nr:sensor histidine kinase [Alteribacillus persepolensis]SDH40452.1 two-component system, CitB family, sensor histidine kinase CitS [Alteribacillus persepolensis]